MQAGDAPATRETILVIDDNEANRALAQGTLEDEGYRVVLASDGVEGLLAFTKEHPDCVLLDVRMPNMDGVVACEQIRAMPGGADTPILFLTALRDIDTFDRAQEAGGDDFLTKPVRPAELVVRVEAALKLRRMREELHEHYELLKHQRDDLMRVQLQKERLTAFVVHDLKNPVNAMDLHAQLLLRDKSLSPAARASASHIRAEARKLNRMIQNLLDVSKADEGKLFAVLSQIDVPALVTDIFSELGPSADVREVHLDSALTATHVRADAELLRRILTNLVENAIRHAPERTTVTVSSALREGTFELKVRDHGKGVPAELRASVFDPFTQLDVESKSRTGRGLGLAFCKLAVLAHGGSIDIEDEGPGATFRVRLPA